VGEAHVSARFVPRWMGLSEVGAISSACAVNECSSLPLQRVCELIGVMGPIAGIPAQNEAQNCLTTFERIRKKDYNG